jgi:hypothetical protein
LHVPKDVYGFLENRAFLRDPFAVEKIMNFGANGGPRARPTSAQEAHEGPQRAQQGLRKLSFPMGKGRFPQTVPKISSGLEEKCKKECAETKLKKRPKKLGRKPVLKALKRLNLITFL